MLLELIEGIKHHQKVMKLMDMYGGGAYNEGIYRAAGSYGAVVELALVKTMVDILQMTEVHHMEMEV